MYDFGEFTRLSLLEHSLINLTNIFLLQALQFILCP